MSIGISVLQSKNIVVSNYVTRSAQTLSLAEKRIIFAGIAKLGGVNGEVKLSALEYSETFDLDIDTAYKQLKSAADNLIRRTLTWEVSDGKTLGMLRCVWLQGYKYFQHEGYISFKFSEYVFPFLFEVGKEFTKYQLRQACALRSIYAWRLLELLEQFRKSVDNKKVIDGWLSISLDEFWHAMEATDSYKANFSLLRQRVIEPAIKELTEKDSWLIDWQPLKKGRKVTALKFKFERNPQGNLFSLGK